MRREKGEVSGRSEMGNGNAKIVKVRIIGIWKMGIEEKTKEYN